MLDGRETRFRRGLEPLLQRQFGEKITQMRGEPIGHFSSPENAVQAENRQSVVQPAARLSQAFRAGARIFLDPPRSLRELGGEIGHAVAGTIASLGGDRVEQNAPCKLGLRIYSKIHRPSESDLSGLAEASTCDVSDVARGAGVMDGGIRALYAPMGRVFGPAITVDLTPGDGLLLRAAIDVAEPGDIIVANAHGDCSRAILGGALAMHMVNRDVRALVVDGAVRDVSEFRELGLPVMARGVTPRSGTTSAGWGEVNVPVACGGAVVSPGDVVIGDEEGLVVVPRRWVAAVAMSLNDTGHPLYGPETIRKRLESLPPKAPVLGMDRVRKAVAERHGIIIDNAHEDAPDAVR